MIFIKNMAEKTEHCADCPLCNYYDDCMLLPFVSDTWEEQYANCPLVEVRKPPGDVIGFKWVLEPITNNKKRRKNGRKNQM